MGLAYQLLSYRNNVNCSMVHVYLVTCQLLKCVSRMFLKAFLYNEQELVS